MEIHDKGRPFHYWVLAADGDPIPAIGSGFRALYVRFGKKYVTLTDPVSLASERLSIQQWDQLPHLLVEPEQDLGRVLEKLRRYRWQPLPPSDGLTLHDM